MKNLKIIPVLLALFLPIFTTPSIAKAGNTQKSVTSVTTKNKTIKKTIKVKKVAAKKVAKKSPLILVFGTDTCGRTTRMRQQLTNSKINYKYRNLDDPKIDKQMWNMLRRYELKSDYVSLPVVYVKGHVFLNPSLEDVKSKI